MIIGKELLIIAFVPRSGCELLTDLMRNASIADLHEFYYPYEFSDRIKYFDSIGWDRKIDKNILSDEKRWFEYVVGGGSVKVGWHSHQVMQREADDLFKLVKKKYIYLRRRDKLRQAISWVMAEQTGQWSYNNENSKECIYDRDAITQRILDIVDQETRWNDYFAGIPHMELFYEDFDDNTVDTIREYESLVKDNKYSDIQRQSSVEYKIMRDELSEQWVKWYIGT
jgi:trehalose 2-sulfotransferase